MLKAESLSSFGWDTNESHYLVPPRLDRDHGQGAAIDLGAHQGKLVVVSVGINHVSENESLTVTIWGSPDGADWGAKPLLALPQKSYCGLYSSFLDLARQPYVRFIRAEWIMIRWDRADQKPIFGFYVSVDEPDARLRAEQEKTATAA